MKILIVLFLFVITLPVMALDDSLLDYDLSEDNGYDDSNDVPWTEDSLNVIQPPNPNEFLPVAIDNPPVGFTIYIDESSLSVSQSDLIIRYWLILKAGKSTNAIYEGMKCNTREYKSYAFQNKWDKTKIKTNPVAKWQPIETQTHNRFREEIRQYFFCDTLAARKRDDIIRRLKGQVNVNKYDDYLQ